MTGGAVFCKHSSSIDHLGLLFDIFDYLQDVEVGSTRPTNVDKNRVDERLLREILNLPRHCGGEKQRLPLAL